MATINLDNNDNTFNAPLGETTVDARGGVDTLILDWSTVDGPIRTVAYEGWGDGIRQVLTDDGLNTVDAYNFNVFRLTGGAGNDDLRGWNNADILNGGLGDDTLSGGLGADSIDGGAGLYDTWSADYSSFVATPIVVTLKAGGVTFTVAATSAKIKNIEQLSITTSSGDDIINTSAFVGNDSITTGVGDDTVNSGRGVDYVNTGGGLDTVIMNWAAVTTNITVVGDPRGAGAWWEWQFANSSGDKLNIADYRDTEQFNLTGGSGNDNLRGLGPDRGPNNDVLKGGAGNDTLAGYQGIDTIDGGIGTDFYIGDFTNLGGGVKVDIAAAPQVKALADGSGALGAIAGIERLSLTGTSGDDIFTANPGAYNDSFSTLGGNDVVTTGRGVDTVSTGGGTDTLVMNWGSATTNITLTGDPRSAGAWWEWQFANGSGDKLFIGDYRDTEQFRLTGGSGDDSLQGRGEAFDDFLAGGGGNDSLNSGAGNDTVNGGADTDTWIADQSAKTAAILFIATASQTTAQGATAGLAINKIEILNISTGAGDDNINTSGYTGNDTVNTNNGNDTVNLGGGFDVTNGGAGTDTLFMSMPTATSDISYTFADGWSTYADADGTFSLRYREFEKVNLTGGGGNDSLQGGVDNDTLVGSGGNDYLAGYGSIGGSASGTFDVINGGTGNDRYYGNFDGINKTLNLVLNADGAGNLVNAVTPASKYAALTGIENVTLYTGQGGDTINLGAVAGDQNIYTRDGNDTISVGSGHHYLDGGNGTDTAVVNFSSSTTVITGLAQFGNFTLADTAGLNSVTFSGIEVFDITGGSGNDRLFAYGSDDTLRGGGGNDILYGGAGDDVLYGGAGSDIFRYWIGGHGVDSIMDAAGGDRIKFDNAPDNAFSSIAVGNGSSTANAVIEVETKADGYTYLYFGTNAAVGADITMKLFGTYATNAFQIVNSGRDLKVILGDSNPGTPGDDVLNGTSGNDTLDGGTGNDKLYGKNGDDTLTGGTGNDLLVGGMGYDTLTGGDGVDTFDYNLIAESQPGAVFSDFLTDFTPGTDKIDLVNIDANPVVAGNQAFVFIGVAAFSGEAGELRWEDSTDPLTPDVLQMDVNGDGVPDMEIQLVGSTTGITAANFFL